MKILHFITSIDKKGGGPSRSVPLLAKGQAALGHHVTLLTVRSEHMNIGLLEGSAVTLKILDPNYTKNELREFVLSEKFDLIQLQSIWDLRYHYVAKLARANHIPYVFTPRGMLEKWSLQQKTFKKKLALALYQKKDLNKAACVHTTAEMEAQNIQALNIKAPCAIIPNGIECEKYPCRPIDKDVKKQVLFLSRIHIKKGLELLIEAWERLAKDFPEWRLKIVGNGTPEYINHLNQLINHKQLYDTISISNPVFGNEKIELYQESSLFILPSYSENFGMVVAEAMSCGVPVITTENTPWQLLNTTNTGWCISLSVSSIENTLRQAFSLSPDTLSGMGQRASELIKAQFDYNKIADNTIALYRWIIEGGEKPEFVI